MQAALHLAADAAQRGGRQHALGRAADAEVDVDAGFLGVGGPDDAGDVAVGDELDAGTGLAHGGDQLGMARPVENAGGDLRYAHALGLGQRVEGVGGRRVEIDDAVGIAGTDGDLVHVHVGRIEQAAALGNGQHGQRIGHRLGADGGALQRIDGDVDLGAVAGADLLADVEHRALVHLAFADDDAAPDVDLGQLLAHGIDGGAVGGLLVAPAPAACAAAIAAASVTRATSSTSTRSRPPL